MARVSRLVLLPALAVVLPCAVVGVLAYEWLALEREAAGRRSVKALETAVAGWRRDLLEQLRATAELTAHRFDSEPASRPPFQPLGPIKPPVDEAYLLDRRGELLAPALEPAADGRPVSPAPDLLQTARAALGAGQLAAADAAARRVFVCCAADRDEFGVAFVWYAVWQRVAADREARGAHLPDLIRELDDLVSHGYLGTDNDALEARLLAKRLGGHTSLDPLVAAIDRAGADLARRMRAVTALRRWLAQADLDSAPGTRLIGRVSHDGATSAVVAIRDNEGRWVAMLIGVNSLTEWIRPRLTGNEPFDVAVHGLEASADTTRAVEMPLFPEVPELRLVFRQRAPDIVTERRRERLFLGAIAAALLLALGVGGLAVRDVLRETRTARLRAAFVAAVTHELKTPLASIRLLAETLRWGRAQPARADDLLDTIVDETDRVNRLVDDVLSTSRIERGTHVYHPRNVALPDVVRAAVRRLDSVLQRDGFHVRADIDDGPLVVSADADALERAVVNLLDNAMKYSRHAREIRLTVVRRAGDAEVRIADDGMGIAPSEQERIFERFYRTPEAIEETTGAGLGLSLVRHFAEAHGGRVTVRSELGAGSEFTLWLPLAVPGEAPAHG